MFIIIPILASLLTAALLYYILFKDWDDFLQCIKYLFIPNIISALRGKYIDDIWAETKLAVWLVISLAVGILIYVNIKP